MKSIGSPIFKHLGCGRSFVCVAAMLVVWLLSAGQAKASCGYYVVTGNPSDEMMASQQAMLVHHQAATTPGKDCPCPGPNCSAGKSDSAIPVSAPVLCPLRSRVNRCKRDTSGGSSRIACSAPSASQSVWVSSKSKCAKREMGAVMKKNVIIVSIVLALTSGTVSQATAQTPAAIISP